jgi:hypothetical protein
LLDRFGVVIDLSSLSVARTVDVAPDYTEEAHGAVCAGREV